MPYQGSLRASRLVAAATISILTTAAALAGTKTVHVYGTIYDTATHRPMAGAQIVISDEGSLIERVVADDRGQFSVVGLYPGLIKVVAAQNGYSSDQLTCLVRAGNSAAFDLAIAPNSGDVEHERYLCPVQTVTQDTYQR